MLAPSAVAGTGRYLLALAANVGPTEATAWTSIPSWAVLGTEDRVIPNAVQRRMAERAGATVSKVDASHVSTVSYPDVTVADLLDDLAQALPT